MTNEELQAIVAEQARLGRLLAEKVVNGGFKPITGDLVRLALKLLRK